MPVPLRRTAWWVWVVPLALGADVPLLGLGFFAAFVTDKPVFTLWGWLSAIFITALAMWMASRDISYGYWLGILASTTGVCVLLLHRMLWEHRKEWHENLHRLAPVLQQNADVGLLRYIGLFAIVFGVLFVIYDAVAQRRA